MNESMDADAQPSGEMERRADELDRLLPHVYGQLRQVARRQLAVGAPPTLTPTVLVHEAYLRLARDSRLRWLNPAHFLGIAARCMRHIIIDYARTRRAAKRGGCLIFVSNEPDEFAEAPSESNEAAARLGEALAALATSKPSQYRVAQCRLVLGLTDRETADALAMPLRSTQREWQQAKRWLAVAVDGARVRRGDRQRLSRPSSAKIVSSSTWAPRAQSSQDVSSRGE
jgi:RNA polymerase sigma factor (TIGR02999 family)